MFVGNVKAFPYIIPRCNTSACNSISFYTLEMFNIPAFSERTNQKNQFATLSVFK